MKSQKDILANVGKRVDEIIANSKQTMNLDIHIHASVDEIPTITYKVKEYAGYDTRVSEQL